MPWSTVANIEPLIWQYTVYNSKARGNTTGSLRHRFQNMKIGQFLKEPHLLLTQTPKINIFTRQSGMFLLLFLKYIYNFNC